MKVIPIRDVLKQSGKTTVTYLIIFSKERIGLWHL